MNQRLATLIATLLVTACLAACSCELAKSDEDVPRSAPGVELCQQIDLPIKYLRQDGLKVETLLLSRTKDAVGMRAMLALLGPWTAERVGRFQPVLKYLAKRYELESRDGAPTPPPPSRAVIENARQLDRFLEDGGCG